MEQISLLNYAAYFAASLLFVLGLRDLTHPDSARRGTTLAAIGMLIAVVGTLLHEGMRYEFIVLGFIVGTVIGIPMGLWIPMTKMPERIALSHSFGGLAVSLVGVVEYIRNGGLLDMHASGENIKFAMGATGFEVLLGSLTFTGSLMAFGKLQGLISGAPKTFKFQNFITVGSLAVGVGMAVFLIFNPTAQAVFFAMFTLAFVLGVLLVLPIGGADMPVVICLLNSYAGLAAAASGFALHNYVLIICGALDGGSGFILAMLMSKAMNRSFANVLFGAFGTETTTAVAPTGAVAGINEASVEDAAEVLRAARSLIVVPGYGMAVAQAQHAMRELADILEKNGTTVKYAIHPVAGRMPGHMNVLLAEANVPYEQLLDLEQINDDFATTDAAMVVGANDVVNPAARKNTSSPIYGMPILNADHAKTCLVLKRSMNPGFAGIENELFNLPNTLMVFGDAKKTITGMAQALKA